MSNKQNNTSNGFDNLFNACAYISSSYADTIRANDYKPLSPDAAATFINQTSRKAMDKFFPDTDQVKSLLETPPDFRSKTEKSFLSDHGYTDEDYTELPYQPSQEDINEQVAQILLMVNDLRVQGKAQGLYMSLSANSISIMSTGFKATVHISPDNTPAQMNESHEQLSDILAMLHKMEPVDNHRNYEGENRQMHEDLQKSF